MSSGQQQHRRKQVEGEVQVPPVVPEPASEPEEAVEAKVPETPVNAAEDHPSLASGTAEAETQTGTPGKKRRRKRGRLVNVDEVMPGPSIWPIALAFALVVVLLGIIIHPLVIVLGALLVLGTVIGWSLERR